MHIRKLLDWRKALIYLHRWTGILLTIVFVVWFVSGVIFVYVGMPTLPAEERLLQMKPLDLVALAIAPADAAARRAEISVPRPRRDVRGPSRLPISIRWNVADGLRRFR